MSNFELQSLSLVLSQGVGGICAKQPLLGSLIGGHVKHLKRFE